MDIKLENILISNSGLLKLCDFGLSTPTDQLISRILGTKSYMAPEIYTSSKRPCCPKLTDMFSLGVLFYILAFGAPPFHTAETSDPYFMMLTRQASTRDFFKVHPHTKKLFHQGLLDRGIIDLLGSMLHPDPLKRVKSLADLFANDFMTGASSRSGSKGLRLEQAGEALLRKLSLIQSK
jgi:serine/threonine protein kinase